MRKGIALLVLCLCLLFSGCSQGGVGDKVIIKAIYIEWQTTYTVHLLALKADPNADTADVKEQVQYLTGTGVSLYDAFLMAEQSENRQIFYGQNELLLVGPGLARTGLFDACNYLAKESSGRPNMAVYGISLSPDQLQELDDKGLDLLENMNQLEAHGFYKTYLYELSAQAGSGILPMVSADEEGKTAPDGLHIYKDGTKAQTLDNSGAEMAALISGQRRDFHFNLQLKSGPVGFDLRFFDLSFESLHQQDSLGLNIRLTGHIQKPITLQGVIKPGPNLELTDQINSAMQQLMQELVDKSIGQGNDVFSLSSWMKNTDERLFMQLETQQPDILKESVHTHSKLSMM